MNQNQSLQLQQLQAQAAELKSLNWFSAYVAHLALGVVKGIVQGIKPGTLQRAILLGFPAGEQFITVLSDGNPNNEAQAREIWQKFISETLPDFAESELDGIANGIADEETRELVLVGGNIVVRGLRLFTDADPDNKAQLSVLLKDLAKDERTKKAVLLFAIELAQDIENEKTRAIVIGLLTGLLENGGFGIG
jgi:hypothetical protein